MSRLPVPISKELRSGVDDAALDRVWRGVQRRRAAAARRRPVQWFAAVGCAAAAVALIVLAWRGWGDRARLEGAGPLRFADDREITTMVATSAPATFAFTDGSHVDLGPGTRLELLDNGATSFSALLASGRATFDVRAGGPRRWSVECGVLGVEVIGTRFTVERVAGGARVSVQHGVVLVRGERVRDRVQRLTEGESLEVAGFETELVPTASATAIVATATVAAATVAAATAAAPPPGPESPATPPARPSPSTLPPTPLWPAAAASMSTAPSASSSEPPAPPAPAAAGDWRKLAERRDNAGAYAVLGPSGIASSSQNASVDDLLALADVARLSGHPADAVAPLTRVVADHPDDPRAPLAAFTLGRLSLDALGRPAQAAAAFQRAIQLGLPQSLREDAYARLVEARSRAGDEAGARTAARDYEQQFPDGKRLREVQRWVHGD
jgi:transmembrane sensor